MKKRADQLLLEKKLCDSRSEAQRLILAGAVRVGTDHVVRKTSDMLALDADLHVTERYPYVSRGAEKILAAIRMFKPEIEDKVALDIGASTGGFTDVLLQYGAARVYAVDVGYGQLHQKLRDNPRVVCIERVNARYLTPHHVPEHVDVLTADLSFISVRKVLPVCDPLLKPGGYALILIKPQFEARRRDVGKGGVVRDSQVQKECVDTVCGFAENELQWTVLGTVPSPITGPKGNQEFMAAFIKPNAG
ncbi:MAG: TlyA family RNA methyltransferase [Candidatus Pacebacteria bacterium]|nr:TlyA family RNA methyltransferase [Candidatus Paceibacterota bacterium]